MRVIAVVVVVCVALAAGAVAIVESAAASGRDARFVSGEPTSPSWSPDGKQVLIGYVRGALGTYRIVRTSSRPGGMIRTVYAERNHYAAFGPLLWARGGRIVFQGRNGLWYSIGVHGGKPTPIVFPTCKCGPSAAIINASRGYAAATFIGGVAPHAPDSIALLKLKPGHNPVVITSPLTAEEQNGSVNDDVVGFSANGNRLVFSRTPVGSTGPSVLMAIRLSGGGSVPLAQSGLPGAARVPSDAQQVQWSPDGRWVAYFEGQSPYVELAAVRTTGASARRVLGTCLSTNYFSPGLSWSSTSKWIAYNCVTDGSAELHTVRPDGTHRTHLLRQFAGYTGPWEGELVPQWSPNGSRLLVLAGGEVWTIRPDGHALTRIG